MKSALAIAEAELNTTEIIGNNHNPRIVLYHTATKLNATSDEVPWCASFVNWCLQEAGIKGTNSSMARSFAVWGRPVLLEDAIEGDVVLLSRGGSKIFGHVGFYVKHDDEYIYLLGGNQSNSVNIAAYSINRLISIRRKD